MECDPIFRIIISLSIGIDAINYFIIKYLIFYQIRHVSGFQFATGLYRSFVSEVSYGEAGSAG